MSEIERKVRKVKYRGGVICRRGVWYIRFRWDERDVRESSKSRSKEEAKELLRQRIAEVRSGAYRPGASSVRLSDLRVAVENDLEANGRKYAKRVGQLFAHLERLIGADATADRIGDRLDAYIKTRLSEGAARGSINRELAILRRGYNLMIKRRRLTTKPVFDMLRENNVRTRFPSEEEIESVVARLPRSLQPAMRFAAITGWRIMEVLNLQWRHVDLDAGTIRVEASELKRDDAGARILPYAFDPRLAEIIAARKRETARWESKHATIVPSVFWHVALKPKRAEPYRAYNYTWKRACKAAGVADLHVHDMRRAFARRAVKAGVDRETVMALAGWKTESAFKRYSVRTQTDLEDGVRMQSEAAKAKAAKPTKAKRA